MSEKISENCTKQELEELLLYSSRHGDSRMVSELLAAKERKSVDFDISCKGNFFINFVCLLFDITLFVDI